MVREVPDDEMRMHTEPDETPANRKTFESPAHVSFSESVLPASFYAQPSSFMWKDSVAETWQPGDRLSMHKESACNRLAAAIKEVEGVMISQDLPATSPLLVELAAARRELQRLCTTQGGWQDIHGREQHLLKKAENMLELLPVKKQ